MALLHGITSNLANQALGRVQFVVVKNLRVLIYSKLHAKRNVITR